MVAFRPATTAAVMLDRIHSVALNLFIYMGLAFLMGCLIPAGIIIYWLVDTEPPLKAANGVFVGWDANRQNVALIEWTGIRQRSCPGVSYRFLVGDQVWDLPDRKIFAIGPVDLSAKPQRWVVPVEIPWEARDSKDGYLNYWINVNYVCNPLHNWWPVTLTIDDVLIPNPPLPGPTPPH